MSFGLDEETLRNDYGHNIGKLTQKAVKEGLETSDLDDEILEFMNSTDTVISSRYMRLGIQKSIPLDVIQITCKKLHEQVIQKVYDDGKIDRRPKLQIRLEINGSPER